MTNPHLRHPGSPYAGLLSAVSSMPKHVGALRPTGLGVWVHLEGIRPSTIAWSNVNITNF